MKVTAGGGSPLHRTEGGIEFIELDLVEMQIMSKVSRKRLRLLSRLHQPLEEATRIDLEDSRRAPDAQPLSQTRDDVHDEVR